MEKVVNIFSKWDFHIKSPFHYKLLYFNGLDYSQFVLFSGTKWARWNGCFLVKARDTAGLRPDQNPPPVIMTTTQVVRATPNHLVAKVTMSIIITVGRAVIGGGDAGVTKVETTTPTTGGGGGATEAMTIEERQWLWLCYSQEFVFGW